MVSSVLAEAILSQRAPDIVGSFKAGRAEARQEQVKTLTGEALRARGGAALEQLRDLDPKIALELGSALRASSAADIEDFVRDASVGKRLLQSGNTQGFVQFAQQRSNTLRQQGRDTSQTDRVLDLVRTGNSQQALDELTAFTGALGKAQEISQVQSSDILPDGTVIQVMKDGSTQVKSAAGVTLEGQDRTDAIREAQQFGIEITGRRAGERAEVGGEAKSAVERRTVAIDRGLEAADSTANLRRALDLMELVETGGVDAAALSAKQLFGVEGADEGELSNRLGVAVLSQLKATFGAAFTAQEGERLERLSAGFKKSPAANKRILQQALAIAERAARRGIRAARASGDDATVQEIEDALEFVLTDQGATGGQTTVTAQQTAVGPAQAQQRTISVDF